MCVLIDFSPLVTYESRHPWYYHPGDTATLQDCSHHHSTSNSVAVWCSCGARTIASLASLIPQLYCSPAGRLEMNVTPSLYSLQSRQQATHTAGANQQLTLLVQWQRQAKSDIPGGTVGPPDILGAWSSRRQHEHLQASQGHVKGQHVKSVCWAADTSDQKILWVSVFSSVWQEQLLLYALYHSGPEDGHNEFTSP